MLEIAALLFVYFAILAAGDLCALLFGVGGRTRVSWLAWRWLFGSGAIAVVMMLAHALRIPFSLATIALPIALLWLAWVLLTRRRGSPSPGRPFVLNDVLLAMLFLLALVHGLSEPIYLTDPITIYGQNARVFEVHRSLAPDALKALVDPGHIEYPPLIPLGEALTFLAAPSWRAYAVKPIFALFFLAVLALARDEIARRLTPRIAWLLLLVFALTPEFSHYGARGFADLPLTAFLLAFVVLACASVRTGSARAGVAAGVMLGFAALTKNEGFAVAVMIAPVLLGTSLLRRVEWRASLAMTLPALTLGLAWYLFRKRHGLEDDLFYEMPASAIFANLSRVPLIIEAFARALLRRNLLGYLMWGTFWFALPVGMLIALFPRGPSRRAIVGWSAALALHLALYVVIFVITPRNLEWHLTSAAERLVIHLVPWALLLWIAALERAGYGAHARAR
jgi:uncharacterized membrane protein (UPF0136 family)